MNWSVTDAGSKDVTTFLAKSVHDWFLVASWGVEQIIGYGHHYRMLTKCILLRSLTHIL